MGRRHTGLITRLRSQTLHDQCPLSVRKIDGNTRRSYTSSDITADEVHLIFCDNC